LPPLKFGHNPFLNDLDQLLSAFFKGLACSPDAHEARNMSIIRIEVIDYLVFGPFECCLDVFSEHAIFL